jgi:hypothetical protein
VAKLHEGRAVGLFARRDLPPTGSPADLGRPNPAGWVDEHYANGSSWLQYLSIQPHQLGCGQRNGARTDGAWPDLLQQVPRTRWTALERELVGNLYPAARWAGGGSPVGAGGLVAPLGARAAAEHGGGGGEQRERGRVLQQLRPRPRRDGERDGDRERLDRPVPPQDALGLAGRNNAGSNGGRSQEGERRRAVVGRLVAGGTDADRSFPAHRMRIAARAPMRRPSSRGGDCCESSSWFPRWFTVQRRVSS